MKGTKFLLTLLTSLIFSACTEVDITESIIPKDNEANTRYENVITMATDAFMAISSDSRAYSPTEVLEKEIDGSSQIRFLYHCNWGWDGDYDGYFLSNAFYPLGDNSPDMYKFNYNVKATYFITKP